MKKILLINFIIFLNLLSICQNVDDTLRISFSIALGEFGTADRAVLITKNNIKLVKYKKSSYGIKLQKDTIYNFYNTNKYNYIVLNEISLDSDLSNYVQFLLNDIMNKKFRKGYSNSPSYYVISSDSINFVLIDPFGDWGKNLEITYNLGLLNSNVMISIDSINVDFYNQLSFIITLKNTSDSSYYFKPKSVLKYLKIYLYDKKLKRYKQIKYKTLSNNLNEIIQIPAYKSYSFKVNLSSKHFLKNHQYKLVLDKTYYKEKKNDYFIGQIYYIKETFIK